MKISAVIPLFNKRDTILRTLDSVMKQTVLPDEIIVVNDGSTDGSPQQVEAYNHPLVRLVHQTNSGVSAARNKGIETATGDWIAFLDADDEWLPGFLETMHVLSDKFIQCQVVASSYNLQDHPGTSKAIILRRLSFNGESGILDNYFEVASCSHPPICSSAVLATKEALTVIGGFPVGIKSGEDLVTWARLAVRFPIAYSTKPLSVFIREAAHTYDDIPNRVPDQPDYVAEALIRLLEENKSTPGLKKYIAHWYKMRGSVYLRLGMTSLAIRESIRSATYNPYNLRTYSYFLLALLPVRARGKIFKALGR